MGGESQRAARDETEVRRLSHKIPSIIMAPTTNTEWVFKSRPKPSGFEPSDFELQACVVPTPQDGELLIATHLFSMDPTMRNAMAGPSDANRTDGSQYWAFMNWEPNTVVQWTVVSQVIESKSL